MTASAEHNRLVKKAVAWLKRPYVFKGLVPWGEIAEWKKTGCGVAVPELVTVIAQQPDAFGWTNMTSYLIECKVSRSDFLRDLKKPHHKTGGVGLYRMYLCPPLVLEVGDMPPGWGLLYTHGSGVRMITNPTPNPDRNLEAELIMMYSLLRRVEVRGDLKKCLAPKWGGDSTIPQGNKKTKKVFVSEVKKRKKCTCGWTMDENGNVYHHDGCLCRPRRHWPVTLTNAT